MKEKKISDTNLVAYLHMKSIPLKRIDVEKQYKYFVYNEDEKLKEVLIEYYNSDMSRFVASLNYVKTLIYKNL
jgi:hypothetical protein